MKHIINVGLITALLTGCGAEIAYKRGATAEDLKAEKNACLKAADEKELEKCMEKNGWAIQKLDGSELTDDDLFATASVAKDNRMTSSNANGKGTIKTTEGLKAEEVTEAAEEGPEVSAVKGTASLDSPSSKPKPSLFDNYVIKSWWKMGAGADLLDKDMTECSEKLGHAHQPNKKTFTYTRGFAICMREKGWRGLIEK